MRPKCSIYIATSLDGFISRLDGGIDWLEVVDPLIPAGEDCGFAEHMATVDAMVMGRETFETAVGFGGEWPYGQTRIVVWTRQTDYGVPVSVADCVTTSGEEPARLLESLAAEGVTHVYVDGGLTIRSFLAEDLIDEITITTIPMLIGEGRPLFGPLKSDIELEFLWSRSWDFGLVQTKYAVRRSSD
ncbi:MAG: dihydrofolate reductase family protein [Thermoanaerobaculia bacterium]|nr:dihydrofolate reductase family protein [Thermoanaerobaculia bacterium]